MLDRKRGSPTTHLLCLTLPFGSSLGLNVRTIKEPRLGILSEVPHQTPQKMLDIAQICAIYVFQFEFCLCCATDLKLLWKRLRCRSRGQDVVLHHRDGSSHVFLDPFQGLRRASNVGESETTAPQASSFSVFVSIWIFPNFPSQSFEMKTAPRVLHRNLDRNVFALVPWLCPPWPSTWAVGPECAFFWLTRNSHHSTKTKHTPFQSFSWILSTPKKK